MKISGKGKGDFKVDNSDHQRLNCRVPLNLHDRFIHDKIINLVVSGKFAIRNSENKKKRPKKHFLGAVRG